MFGRTTAGFVSTSRFLIRKSWISLFLLLGFAAAAGLFGSRLHPAFLPEEDQGYVYCQLSLPNASSLQRTEQAAREVEKVFKNTPGVSRFTDVIGFSLLSTVYSTYNAFFFVTFKPWAERTKPEEQYAAIKDNLTRELKKIPDGNASASSLRLPLFRASTRPAASPLSWRIAPAGRSASCAKTSTSSWTRPASAGN